ncbi:WD40 repeat protein [Microbotryomycetes sp. JL221]|nr:WD40 repeat protein [Microbotryomycetes sp. JL221]
MFSIQESAPRPEPCCGSYSSEMYFPSPLPTTRLSVTTGAVPSAPSPVARPKLTPRSSKAKFRDSLGGVQEEEGEEVIMITRGPEMDDEEGSGEALWAALGREDVSVWSIRPKVVLAKLKRSPVSLRTHGSNASVTFHGPSRLIITTTSGHHLLYSITLATPPGSRKSNAVYIVPGGDKATQQWPKGPGEGHELEGIVLRSEGERGTAVGDGIGCVCVTDHSLLVAIQDPPTLRIIPFPTFTSTPQHGLHQQSVNVSRRNSGWESLPPHLRSAGDTEAIVLDEWPWLVGREQQDLSITALVALKPPSIDSPAQPYTPRRPSWASQNTVDSYAPRDPTRFVMLMSDGRAYLVNWAPPADVKQSDTLSPPFSRRNSVAIDSKGDLLFDEEAATEEHRRETIKWKWEGVCFHPKPSKEDSIDEQERELDLGKAGSTISVNEQFGLVAVGCEDGTLATYNLFPARIGQPFVHTITPVKPVKPTLSHISSLRQTLNTTSTGLQTGRVTSMSWTSDGYALAVGWQFGWAIWSVYGRLGSWSVQGSLATGYGVEGEKSDAFEDHFMNGFWSPGNLELFILCPPPTYPKHKPHDEQLFVVPFAKSAVSSLHTPDNTKHAFLQLDDRVLVYRGADQPDMSVINPESDVWQHIKIPASYIALQHPIRYAVISSDARLIAVAGQRGLTHYNALSGRWKLFELEKEEDSIKVVGGMAWWSNVLIVGCIENGRYQLRIFSRDRPLTFADTIDVIPLESEPLVLAVFESSVLLYTADNTFHHFLISHTRDSTRLRTCGSIGFEGVVAEPSKVRGISWLVPKSQQRFGDPADDLNVATIIFLIDGKLVLLRPRRAAHEEVKYDMQILADRIEFYWTHLSGIGTLENSLWGFDGKQIRIWLDALTIEKVKVDAKRDSYETVMESVAIPLDFYPLAVLMDKGIIVGVDQETSLRRNLDFAIFRIITNTNLFLHHIIRYHLARNQKREAVVFASHYQKLVFFGHALEILLHAVLEDEADARPSRPTTPLRETIAQGIPDDKDAVLPRVVDFLDHFDEALQVVVGCARKTEMARWDMLFSVVGSPRDLFEKCVDAGYLKVAASYLLVLHNLEPPEQSGKDTVRLLKSAMAAGEWTLCRELLRFLFSLDPSGLILRAALSEGQALPAGYSPPDSWQVNRVYDSSTNRDGFQTQGEYFDAHHEAGSNGLASLMSRTRII